MSILLNGRESLMTKLVSNTYDFQNESELFVNQFLRNCLRNPEAISLTTSLFNFR